jgi:replication factor C small subunit
MEKINLIEKMRPKYLEDVRGHKLIINQIEYILKNQNPIPNFLFCGDPGIGKTSTARAIVNEMNDGIDSRFNLIELNAGKERSIDKIRDQVIEFCLSPYVSKTKYSFIIMDECDHLTLEAQGCLRGIMESKKDNIIFILITNNIHSIMEPLRSRCLIFAFKPLEGIEFHEGITKVSTFLGIEIDSESIEALRYHTSGDLRNATHCLEQLSAFKKSIDLKSLSEILNLQTESSIKKYLFQLKNLNLKDRIQLLRDLNSNYDLYGMVSKFIKVISELMIDTSLPDQEIENWFKIYIDLNNLLLENQNSQFIEYLIASIIK